MEDTGNFLAVKKCISEHLNNTKNMANLDDFEKYLFNYNYPKIDLLIRTGGEKDYQTSCFGILPIQN